MAHKQCSNKAWCPGLVKALEFSDGRGKGIRVRVMYSTTTWKPSRKIAMLHSGDFSKNGVILNFCPFCGKNLDKIHRIRKITAAERKAGHADIRS